MEGKLQRILDQIAWLDAERKGLLRDFVKTFARDFVLAWAVRGGVAFLPHLLRMKRFAVIEALQAAFGKTAGRFGLFVALYFALFKIFEKAIRHYRCKQDSWNAFIAGGLASLSLAVEDEGARWMLAQYLLVRALGCAWNNVHHKYPQVAPYTRHGDTLIFALCSGQAVYNYVVRPETVDPAYKQFLTNVTQMDPAVIDLFRSHVHTGTTDAALLSRLVARLTAKGVDVSGMLPHAKLNCQLIHPGQPCWQRIVWVLYANFKMVFPMYFSLHLVPPLLFRTRKSLSQLEETLKDAVQNGVQSSSFMSTYVFIFQILLCVQRNLMDAQVIKGEWRYSFWLMGFISAASILIEKKARRAELVLYMLPRAGVSLYRTLVEKGWARNVPCGELAMMALSMAVLMKTYRKDQKMLSPIVARIFRQFLQ